MIAIGLTGSFGETPAPPISGHRGWSADAVALLARLERVARPGAYAVNELQALRLFVRGDRDLDARVLALSERWAGR